MIELRILIVLLLMSACTSGCSRQSSPAQIDQTIKPEKTGESRSRPAIVDYAPGLRINYRVPQVEIDAEVILREASLELFLYSKASVPKEHESILKTLVPPQRIYEALGLIGLRPGKPARYMQDTAEIRPASGDPVAVFVKYQKDGRQVEEPATNWMFDVSKKQTMVSAHWLFSGSEKSEDGSMAADEEGTTITVVDFPSSLVSLPASHTSSDSELWLKANTEKIPPLKTRVTVILRKP